MHRVVILGGGFGGLYAAKALGGAAADVTLVDRRNFHLFQPLLYQVATGTLSPGEIAYPLRSILRRHRNTRVLLAEAVDLDVERGTLILERDTLPYDSLIVATGARSHFFGRPEWAEHAPPLKSIEDATRIRSKLLYAFEAAEREPDPVKRRAWLTFVIVGAGPTGVELAGTLAEIANDVLKNDFRAFHPQESRILLFDGNDRVLQTFDPKLSMAAEQSLIRLGVRSRLNVRVTHIDAEGVRMTTPFGEETLEARTVIWAAGVTGDDFNGIVAERCGVPRDRAGRIAVAPDCTVPGHPNIFVIGDLAYLEDERGQPLPGVCQVAMQQGAYAARAIRARLEQRALHPFRYRDRGNMAVIGRHSAVAEIGPSRFSGWIAWLLWLFIHLMYLAGFQNRLIVFTRWGFNYLTYNRGARLITGDLGAPPKL